jgi:hypothetical protein
MKHAILNGTDRSDRVTETQQQRPRVLGSLLLLGVPLTRGSPDVWVTLVCDRVGFWSGPFSCFDLSLGKAAAAVTLASDATVSRLAGESSAAAVELLFPFAPWEKPQLQLGPQGSSGNLFFFFCFAALGRHLIVILNTPS